VPTSPPRTTPTTTRRLHRSQDIQQAKFLLKKAGHENLTVQLVTSPVATGTVSMSTVLKQQAQAAGVTINLKQVDPTTFFWPQLPALDVLTGLLQLLALPGAGRRSRCCRPSPFNETHWSLPHYIDLYKQANATANAATRKQIEHEMQMIDFNEGGYIIPAFIAALDAYSTKITGYSAARVGQPLSDFDFEHYSFA
jgi:peptide/nickel transport system substrate-binding protein